MDQTWHIMPPRMGRLQSESGAADYGDHARESRGDRHAFEPPVGSVEAHRQEVTMTETAFCPGEGVAEGER